MRIIVIEDVQRKITKYLLSLKYMTYEEKLKELNLWILWYRRMSGDIIETHRTLIGKYDRTVTQSMPQQQHNSTSLSTPGHGLKLYWQREEKGLRQSFLTISVANHLNEFSFYSGVFVIWILSHKLAQRYRNIYSKETFCVFEIFDHCLS